MKLVSFLNYQKPQIGVLLENGILPIPASIFPQDMLQLIQAGPETLDLLRKWVPAEDRELIPVVSGELFPPLHNPGKIMAIGLNYKDHCREQNVALPDRPIVFTKFNSSIIGPGDAISWDSQLTNQVDYEVELAVVIGKKTRRVPVDQATGYIFGYTIINDVSARDLQFSDRQWVRAKSLDTFCPMGPAIVTADEVPDPQSIHLSCKVNGVTMQDSSTAEMVFGVAELVSRLSHAFTLEPGDIISTGTPAGVGVFRNPQVFLKHGDRILLEVEKVGRLENFVQLT